MVMMISGFMNAPYAIARRLLVQRNTAPEVRGRVASGYYVSSNLFFLIGMGAAGLADIVDVRLLYLLSALVTIGTAIWALVLPGIGQPAAEWRRALALLRQAPGAIGLGAGRAVLPADVDLLFGLVPALRGLSNADRDRIQTQGRILEVQPETRLMSAGESGDSAYFVLLGRAVAGVSDGQGSYRSLSSMTAGDYFGEIGALTGAARTADVVAQEDTVLLQVSAATMRMLMTQSEFSQMVLARMSERLTRTSIRDLPRFTAIDPQSLRELREESPAQPKLETVPA
jgi:CRP-like cAMP-binding protein